MTLRHCAGGAAAGPHLERDVVAEQDQERADGEEQDRDPALEEQRDQQRPGQGDQPLDAQVEAGGDEPRPDSEISNRSLVGLAGGLKGATRTGGTVS